MDLIFAASSLLVLPFWLLMIGLPGWRGTRKLMESYWVLLPIPLLYVVLLFFSWRGLEKLIADPRLPTLAEILGRPEGALIGWVHFLAFDLFVGRWEYLDSQERRYPPILVAPALWATLLVGPLGLLLYLAIRALVPPIPAVEPGLPPET
jgi:ABA4-like protein